jgi:carboxymethylenebutenolidase
MVNSWENVKVDDGSMRLYLSLPDKNYPVPGIIVIHGQTGLDNFIEETTRMIAREGYAAVAPDLFHRDGPDCKDDGPARRARLRDSNVIEDVNAASEFLKKREQVDATRLGIVGFCMGGRVVYLMAAVSADLKAGVMYYGGNTMTAWGDGPSPFDRTREIRCPLLGHFGEEDENPSPEDMRKLDAELKRWGKAHEFYSYPGAAHAFANLGSPKYRAHAANASWPRTFAFFSRQLVGESTAAAAVR